MNQNSDKRPTDPQNPANRDSETPERARPETPAELHEAELSAWLLGETDSLSPERISEIEARLESEPAFREEVELLSSTIQLVRDLPNRSEALESARREEVIAAAQAPTSTARVTAPSKTGWWIGLGLAAAAVVAAAFIFQQLQDSGGPDVDDSLAKELGSTEAETIQLEDSAEGELLASLIQDHLRRSTTTAAAVTEERDLDLAGTVTVTNADGRGVAPAQESSVEFKKRGLGRELNGGRRSKSAVDAERAARLHNFGAVAPQEDTAGAGIAGGGVGFGGRRLNEKTHELARGSGVTDEYLVRGASRAESAETRLSSALALPRGGARPQLESRTRAAADDGRANSWARYSAEQPVEGVQVGGLVGKGKGERGAFKGFLAKNSGATPQAAAAQPRDSLHENLRLVVEETESKSSPRFYRGDVNVDEHLGDAGVVTATGAVPAGASSSTRRKAPGVDKLAATRRTVARIAPDQSAPVTAPEGEIHATAGEEAPVETFAEKALEQESLLEEGRKQDASKNQLAKLPQIAGKAANLNAEPGKSDEKRAAEKEPAAAEADVSRAGDAGGAGAAAAPVAAVDPSEAVRARIDELLSRLDRRSGETPDAMFFRFWGDNPFVETLLDSQSTFGVDVDTASYTLMRSYLDKRGQLPPPEAIRTEEFVNSFDAGYAAPAAGDGAFAVSTELAPSPYAHDKSYKLLRVGVKAREVERSQRKACNLVFVVDTSGSMRRETRIELVKEALLLLVDELDEGDQIGIVAFDATARRVLDPTPAGEQERIKDAIRQLATNHSTNVGAGLDLGYAMAAERFIDGANNRVILLSDGVANTGITEQAGILAQVHGERRKGVFLTCVGVGMGNHNDALLEQLADRGDGQCVYVDRIDAARKVFVDNLTATLETVARDVKIQVEFERDKVLRYRQLGYENRAIADASFRDNQVDAGETGAGHEVTALYEVKLADGAADDIAKVRVRYLTVDPRPAEGGGEAVEMEHEVKASSIAAEFDAASPTFRLQSLVAEFAEILRDSYWARGSDLAQVADKTQALLESTELGKRDDAIELVALMRRADALVKARNTAKDEVAKVVDAMKENQWLRTQCEILRDRRKVDTRQYLQELRQQNDTLRKHLEGLLVP